MVSDRFVKSNEESFFTNAERSLITKFMLDITSYKYDDEIYIGTYKVLTVIHSRSVSQRRGHRFRLFMAVASLRLV